MHLRICISVEALDQFTVKYGFWGDLIQEERFIDFKNYNRQLVIGVDACSLNIWDVDDGCLGVQDHPLLYNKFEDSLVSLSHKYIQQGLWEK